MKIKTSIIIAFLLFPLFSLSQPADSLIIKSWEEQAEEARKRTDSLSKEFHSQIPYLTVSFELNREEKDLTDKDSFYAIYKGKIFTPVFREENKFLFENLPDSIQLVFETNNLVVKSETFASKRLRFGARIIFGWFDNLLEIKELMDRNKKNEDFFPEDDIGQPYFGAVKDRRLVRAARRGRIDSIEFVSITPRIYGTGYTISYLKINNNRRY